MIRIIYLFIFFFASCNKYLSEISIYSNLQKGDSISIAIYSKNTEQYITVNGTTVTSEDVIRGCVDIPLPDSLIKKIHAFSVTIHSCSDNILAISSIRLKDFSTIYSKDIINSLFWQHGLIFEFDSQSNTLKSHINKNIPATFNFSIIAIYKSFPTSLQLFLRLIFLATLLLLLFLHLKHSPTQRLLFFALALFFASLPLKTDYTNYTMGIMCLTMLIAFLRFLIFDFRFSIRSAEQKINTNNKSIFCINVKKIILFFHLFFRHFTWQPIFYVLCAMYFLNVIGLLYTGDLSFGMKRLDTSVVLVLFPFVFSLIRFSKENVILVLRFFVWAVVAFCMFGFLSYATIVPELTYDMIFKDSKLYAPLLMMWPAHSHPSYLSTILLMAVPIALYLRYNHEKKQITMLEVLLGVLTPIIFTVLSGARVGIVIAPALLGLGYLFYCKFRPVFKWGLVVAGIALMGVMFHLFPKVDDRFVDPIRVDLRKTAISAIKEKPVFGWGTGYVRPLIYSEERARSIGLEASTGMPNFHNQYLEDMVQFGIVGIVILLTLFGWMLWIGIREKNYLLLSLLTIYVLFCWTENALAISKGVVPFTFWLCFLISNRDRYLNSTQMTKTDAENL